MREVIVNCVCFFLFFISGLSFSCAEDETTTTIYTTTTFITTTTDSTSNSNSVDDVNEDPCQDLLSREDSSSTYEGAVLCRTHSDCEILDQLCCPTPHSPGKRVCVKPAARNHVTVTHAPLLGIVPRHCPPEERLPEPLAVKSCETDADCWPRVCCPEGGQGAGASNHTSYCRTPQPPWQRLVNTHSRTSRLLAPLRNMMAYMQCTPPPPPLYDLFPKECRSMLDCFPNLCCQEHDRKVCRPPRKSLLALFSNFVSIRR
ncbi:hypothetical protein LSTR_LSTR013937 [Laodelphax striatellus]|uniref:WAP domain-containing protein n=1 Tax=Laodelphax striatellus TaxID=195883 RepID=A0A482WST6_LAOST|nr:hypothetical protein LSTR_LSTR013937 [Laodelphax striatellus]